MLTKLYNLIGSLTLPEGAVEDECGYWWVERYGLPTGATKTTAFGVKEVFTYQYDYNYQKIEQNWFGKWRLTNVCQGLDYSIGE